MENFEIKNYRKFNRNNYFDRDILSYHMDTIRIVQDLFLDRDDSILNELTNKLYGILDGYLYFDLIDCAEWYRIPIETIMRIRAIIQLIEDRIEQDKAIKQWRADNYESKVFRAMI